MDTGCSQQTIENRHVYGGEGDLLYRRNGSNHITIKKATYICTDFSEEEDWTTGEQKNIYFTAANNTLDFWIGLVKF